MIYILPTLCNFYIVLDIKRRKKNFYSFFETVKQEIDKKEINFIGEIMAFPIKDITFIADRLEYGIKNISLLSLNYLKDAFFCASCKSIFEIFWLPAIMLPVVK